MQAQEGSSTKPSLPKQQPEHKLNKLSACTSFKEPMQPLKALHTHDKPTQVIDLSWLIRPLLCLRYRLCLIMCLCFVAVVGVRHEVRWAHVIPRTKVHPGQRSNQPAGKTCAVFAFNDEDRNVNTCCNIFPSFLYSFLMPLWPATHTHYMKKWLALCELSRWRSPNTETGVWKNLHFSLFKWPKTLFACQRRVQMRGKMLVLQNIHKSVILHPKSTLDIKRSPAWLENRISNGSFFLALTAEKSTIKSTIKTSQNTPKA